MQLPIDPKFPDKDEDAALLSSLADQPVRPVFIMGLHRSGTTFLYDSLSRSFPLAHLTLYHLFYFDRLLANHQQHLADVDRQRLDECLRALGIADRHIDQTAVGANEVEEYGFLLRLKSGSFHLSDNNRHIFSILCQKLLAVEPGCSAVLLKNPWDIGNGKWMAEHFPQARFVYISREPIAVLNSALNAVMAYLDGPQPYLELLLGQGRGRKGYRLGYWVWKLARSLRRLIGQRAMSLLLRPILARQVARQIAAYRNEVAAMPSDKAVEVDYQALVNDPRGTIQRLQPLLDLPLLEGIDELEPRQRHNANPALKHYQQQLESLIRKAKTA